MWIVLLSALTKSEYLIVFFFFNIKDARILAKPKRLFKCVMKDT